MNVIDPATVHIRNVKHPRVEIRVQKHPDQPVKDLVDLGGTDYLPLKVDALPLSGGGGDMVAVTKISITQDDDADNKISGRYAGNDAVPRSITLSKALPHKNYTVYVAWSDDSEFSASIPDEPGQNDYLVASAG